jgi:ribosomal protein S27E
MEKEVKKEDKIDSHIEEIECPECGKRQMATVYHTMPFYNFVHHCISCKYVIMESEWILVNTEEEVNIKQKNDE